MEKLALKELFFIGSDEEVNAFLEAIKPRCIKVPKDSRYLTINTEYGVEKVVYNSDHDSFFDQHMNEYKIDKFSETLEPIDTFVTVKIHKEQRKKPEGARYAIASETISKKSLSSLEYLVGDYVCNDEFYLYRQSARTHEVYIAPWRSGFVDESEYDYNHVQNVRTFYHTNNDFDGAAPQPDRFVGLLKDIGVVHYIDAEGEVNKCFCFNCDIEDGLKNGDFAICNCCEDIWVASCLEDGYCPKCGNVQIYSYHHWTGKIDFKTSSKDDVENEEMFFGTEIETVGPEENKEVLAPYQDLWHLEEDGSIEPYGFEMISQPMTWKFIEENKDSFENLFSEMSEAGQEAEETDCCGLHIHVSRAAFASDEAVRRAIAIVHRLDEEFKTFSRRDHYEYCEFHHLRRNFTWKEVDNIPHDEHDCAVNCGNVGNPKKDTVEFRFFKSTLDVDTYLAAIELVKAIVETANSSEMTVTLRKLMQGHKYVTAYVKKQMEMGLKYHLDSYVCNFTSAYLDAFVKEFANTNNPYQVMKDFTELLAKTRNVDVIMTKSGYCVINPLTASEDAPSIGKKESEVE